MAPNPALGVFLHAAGGFGAGSFYIPLLRVRSWAWESYWLVGGLVFCVVCPWLVGFLTVPDLLIVLWSVPTGTLVATSLLGIGWGVGNLTFGLSLRYLGMSLGMALSLGFCTFFGTLVPPVVQEALPNLVPTSSERATIADLLATASGQTTLGGVAVCLLGIALTGCAGISKERELPDAVKQETIREFNFVKGAAVATFAGVMSACFAFAVQTGKPIADAAEAHGAGSVWVNGAPVLLILSAGAVTNMSWCLVLNVRNRTTSNYIDTSTPLVKNYFFCLLAGLIAYSEFLFFGMGETQMGEYGFSSWSIHMAFIIVFSNMWGMVFSEWKETSARTRALLAGGLGILITSTVIMGYGNYLKTVEEPTGESFTAPIVESLHQFMDDWCQQGPCHLVALGWGDRGGEVEAFAEAMKFGCVRV